MSGRRTLLATGLLIGTLLTGCSSAATPEGRDTTASSSTVAASSTTSAPTTTVPAATSITPAPAATSPKPPPPPAGPQLSNVALSGYPGGMSCTPGDVLTITLTFSTSGAAGVLIWSSAEGNIGQFPAEFGQAEVPYTCSTSATLFTLYPVAEGGALGTPVNFDV